MPATKYNAAVAAAAAACQCLLQPCSCTHSGLCLQLRAQPANQFADCPALAGFNCMSTVPQGISTVQRRPQYNVRIQCASSRQWQLGQQGPRDCQEPCSCRPLELGFKEQTTWHAGSFRERACRSGLTKLPTLCQASSCAKTPAQRPSKRPAPLGPAPTPLSPTPTARLTQSRY